MESSLSSPCSCSDLPFSRQSAALAHLDSLSPHNLVFWTDGFVPFSFGKSGSGALANSSHYGIEATLSFSAGPVCSSFVAEACAILHTLCWSRQQQQVCHFSSPPPVLFSIFPLTSISLEDLSSLVLLGYNGSPDTRSSRGKTRLMSWPDGERYLRPLQSLTLSPLIFRIHSSLFSDWRCTVSSKFFDK